jgi:hypothetical protein
MLSVDSALRRVLAAHPQAPEAALLRMTLAEHSRAMGSPSYSLFSADAREVKRLLRVYRPEHYSSLAELGEASDDRHDQRPDPPSIAAPAAPDA